jgi:hypothetical protein
MYGSNLTSEDITMSNLLMKYIIDKRSCMKRTVSGSSEKDHVERTISLGGSHHQVVDVVVPLIRRM